MMYNQKLVASLKANGKILREFKDTVYVPFGTEYSVLLKNLNSVRCIVHMSIDGSDVIPDGLVINAGQVVDLERWIKNGNMSEGNKFKFIERTAQIENHKGIGLEDGIISISYQFEQPQLRATTIWDHNTGHWEKEEKWKYVHDTHFGPYNGILRGGLGNTGGWLSASGATTNIASSLGGASFASVNQASLSNVKVTAHLDANISDEAGGGAYNDAGITVPGSKSTQKFAQAAWFPVLPEKHSIVLKLLGETPDNKPVIKPVTVKAKPKCTSCGKMNKSNAKFCTECGTALEIFA